MHHRRMFRALVCLFLFLLTGCAAETSASRGRTEITLGAWVDTGGGLAMLADAFNESQDEVCVRVETYYDVLGSDASSAENRASRDRMQASFVSGDTPDLFFTTSMDAGALYEAGLLGDWYALMDEDFAPSASRDELWAQNAREGVLYELFVNYELVGLGLPAEYYDAALAGRSGWTPAAFTAWLDEAQLSGMTAEAMLRLLQDAGTFADFVDWDAATCQFECEGFYELLAMLAACGGADNGLDWCAGLQSLYLAHYDAIYAPPQGDGFYRRYTGWPTRDGGGVRVRPLDSYAYAAQTPYPEACWAFARWLLEDAQQRSVALGQNGLPISRDIWAGLLEASQYPSDDARSCFYPARMPGRDAEGKRSFVPLPGMPAPKRAYLDALVDGADTLVRRDSALEQIVEEEILPYLAGDRSAADCARNIQRRVSLLLAEGT